MTSSVPARHAPGREECDGHAPRWTGTHVRRADLQLRL